MPGEIAVVCSRADPASLNIYERLLELLSWQCLEGYRSNGRWRLIIHDEKQSRLSGLDDRLAGLGLKPEIGSLPAGMRQKPVCHGSVGISQEYKKTARASFLLRHPLA